MISYARIDPEFFKSNSFTSYIGEGIICFGNIYLDNLECLFSLWIKVY